MRVMSARWSSKGSRLVKDHDIDPGKTVMYPPGGGQLEVITSSAAAAEGAMPTYCVLDETEHWRPANGGVELAQVLSRNLAKTGVAGLETCNAWEPGAGSVAEATFDAWVAQEEGRTRGGARTLYDARVAPPDTDLTDDESLRAGIAHAYGDCWWVDQEIIRDSPARPADPGRHRPPVLPEPARREHGRWATQQEWAAIADPAQVMADVSDGDEIVAFFDGSQDAGRDGAPGLPRRDRVRVHRRGVGTAHGLVSLTRRLRGPGGRGRRRGGADVRPVAGLRVLR